MANDAGWEKTGRNFLEPDNHGVDSYLKWNVELWGLGGKSPGGNATLKMADCTRSIELYFEPDSSGLRKLERLLGNLQEFKDALHQGIKKLEKLRGE